MVAIIIILALILCVMLFGAENTKSNLKAGAAAVIVMILLFGLLGSCMN